MEVVAQAADGDVALARAREHKPDVVLMDVNLPNASGLEVTKGILSEMPATKVVILTGYDESGHIHQALDSGAVAFCTKDVPPEGLLSLIRAVNEGNYFIDGQVMTMQEAVQWQAERTIGGPDEAVEASRLLKTRLSPREMEILELVAQGSSNKEIAFLLSISQQTVKNHMTAILRKLQVEDRTQAAITALRNGWVRLSPQMK
jgi:DNA-binding NarL/FixJ family response regulator